MIGFSRAHRRHGRLCRGAVAAIVLLIAGGCSDDDSSSGDGGGSSPTTTDANTAGQDADDALGTPNAASGTPVRIGLVSGEGGSGVELAEAGDAAQAAAQYANEYLGGLAGHPIEVERCPDRNDPAVAADCANRLVQDGVVAVVTGVTAQGDAMAPIISAAGIPYVTSSPASAAELGTPGVFAWNGGILALLGGMASYAADEQYSSIVMLTSDLPTLRALVDALAVPMFAGVGVTLTPVYIPAGQADASAAVSAAMADDPSAIAVLAEENVCRTAFAAVQTAGATQPVMTVGGCTTEAVVSAFPDVLDGATVFETSLRGDDDDDESRLYDAVLATYAPDTPADGTAALGFQGMLGLVRAVNAAGVAEPTAASILEALRTVQDVPFPAGGGSTFTCDGTAIVIAPTACSANAIIATLDADGLQHDARVVDVGSLLQG